MGEISRVINVRVLFTAVIEPLNAEVYQKEGYLMELQCLVEINPSPTRVYWKREDGMIISQSSDRMKLNLFKGAFNRYTVELIIKRVEKEDFGSYDCYVTNNIGTSFETIKLIRSKTPRPSAKQNKVISSSPVFKQTKLFVLSVLAVLYF